MIENLQKVLQKRAFVVNALLFGSVAKESATPLSDVDIAIQTDGSFDLLELGDLVGAMEEVVQKRVDLVVIDHLAKDDPLFAYQIYLAHKPLLIRDKERYNSFLEEALHFYLDFEPALLAQNEAFKKRVFDGDIAKIKAT